MKVKSSPLKPFESSLDRHKSSDVSPQKQLNWLFGFQTPQFFPQTGTPPEGSSLPATTSCSSAELRKLVRGYVAVFFPLLHFQGVVDFRTRTTNKFPSTSSLPVWRWKNKKLIQCTETSQFTFEFCWRRNVFCQRQSLNFSLYFCTAQHEDDWKVTKSAFSCLRHYLRRKKAKVGLQQTVSPCFGYYFSIRLLVCAYSSTRESV